MSCEDPRMCGVGRHALSGYRHPKGGVGGVPCERVPRDQMVDTRYLEDPLRVPSSQFVPQGYMASGYDTGRVKR